MEPAYSTNYFAVIPRIESLIGLAPKSITAEPFRQRPESDCFLLALISAAAIAVVTVVLNWSW